MTNEPFQPVRIYYSIPDRSHVTERLRGLECMLDVPEEECWQWLFDVEADSLVFASCFDAVPEERRPIVLGRFRFPTSERMTFDTNSILRAIEAAKFFGPRFGREVVAMRCRVVNRFFAAEEGNHVSLMKTLDQNVTVVDPREAEEALNRELAGRTMEDAKRAVGSFLDRKIKNGDDVPLIEDFPLVREEETPEFKHLATSLHFRLVRALEHWKGNTHVTLAAIIMRAVEEHAASRGGC